MLNKILFISTFSLVAILSSAKACYSKKTIAINGQTPFEINTAIALPPDTVPPAEVMDVIKKVVHALDKFDIEQVANLYTPNAVVADDEPPYSWNGPTAGVQWVNAVEKACKDNELTKLKGTVEAVNVYQQTVDNVYLVVRVSFIGNLPGSAHFSAKGAFTFVLRQVNGSWLIKSQAWMPKKGM
ncbi:MAG TPA: nuclear transport factor 2 family protein [Mucilaginibacter sp.]|jgi:ketosteroid isomerase-like protein